MKDRSLEPDLIAWEVWRLEGIAERRMTIIWSCWLCGALALIHPDHYWLTILGNNEP